MLLIFKYGGTVVAISGSGDTTSATFTSPITGIYQFNMSLNIQNAGTLTQSYLYIDGASRKPLIKHIEV